MTPPLGNVGRGSHVNTLLVVLLVSLADVHLRLRCFAVQTTRIPTTTALTTIPTTSLTNNSYQQISPTSPANDSLETPTDDGSYRLPTSVLPVHYDLEVQPYINYTDPDNFTFKGHVSISIRCEKATNKIILHKESLSVDNSSVVFRPETTSPSRDPIVTSVQEDPKRQFLIVRLDKHMEAGKSYLIEMSFTSPLTNSKIGLYYSRSRRGNETVYTVVSQMAPAYARRVFPCFDEPAMKATFTVTVVRPGDRFSLSNTRIVNSATTFTESGVTYVKDVYERSPKMSTLQVTFVICDFEQRSNKTKSNVTYSTWAKSEDINNTLVALDSAVDAHDFFEEYFDIKYPLTKLDLVAIDDFKLAGMSTFGIVTFRDIHMMYEKGVSTSGRYSLVITSTTMLISAIWISNLVSVAWWSDVWIAVGFDNYFRYVCLDKLHPSWNVYDDFIVFKQFFAFTYDHAANSRPLHIEVRKQVDIDSLYNWFVHTKAPAVVRMLSFVLGERTFQESVRNFLKRRLYGTYVRQDLFDEMTQQAKTDGLDINVTDFMETWVLQANFPVVTVTQDFKTNELYVTQQRFLQDPSDKDTGKYLSPFNYRWNIPLTLATSRHRVFNQTAKDVYWMKRDEPAKTIRVKFPLPRCTSCNSWILANVNWYGLYRVNYHIGNWLALCKQLKRNHLAIPTSNRAQIVNDAFSLYKANYIPLDVALTTLEYLHKERQYGPWRIAGSEMFNVLYKLETTKLYEPYKAFVQRKVRQPFNRVGLRRGYDEVNLRELQRIIVRHACYVGVRSCMYQAKKIYKDVMRTDGKLPIDPDKTNAVYCYGVALGSTAEWDFALKMYQRTTDAREKGLILSALSCPLSPELLTRYMEYLLVDDSPYPKEHAFSVLKNIIQDPRTKNVAWEFYNRNYKALTDKYNKTFECKTAMTQLTAYFNTREDVDSVMLFWRQHCLADIGKARTKHIQENIEWLDKYGPVIQAWLDKKKKRQI